MSHTLKRFVLLFTLLGLMSCSTNQGSTPEEKRAAILAMKNQVLTDLFAARPSARSQVNSAPGYAVFSNANVNLILASFGGGYGVAKNMRSGQHTYMKMGEVGIGFGAGVKDFRIVIVFHSEHALNNFITNGWSFGGQADAAAKAGDKGAGVGGEAIINGATVYQLTESGLALQATIKGTKFWQDETLN